ncbi:MAG: hypothetical protein ACP5D7_03375 [Limnospira sp.]
MADSVPGLILLRFDGGCLRQVERDFMVFNLASEHRDEIYFTIAFKPGAGLTDQLLQFSSFYRLGLVLGYRYVHTPADNFRSSSRVYEFLGFNDFFPLQISEFERRSHSRFSLPISDHKLQLSRVKNIVDLLLFVKASVENFKQKTDVEPILLAFELEGYQRLFFAWIHKGIPDFPDGLNLRSHYEEKRRQHPARSHFQDDKIKLLVHIRQGDTGYLKTPWNTVVPVLGSHQFTELEHLGDLREQYIDIPDYFRMLQKLVQFLGADRLSIAIASDGYDRTFETLEPHLDKLGWTPEQRRQIERSRLDYESREFAPFNQFKNTTILLGETEENLRSFIHACLTADIILVGYQQHQRMIPKLLAIYDRESDPPILVNLHRTPTAPYHKTNLGLTEKKAIQINVKVGESNEDEIVSLIHQKLLEKWTVELYRRFI